MTGRRSHACILAVAYVRRKRCTPAAAAKRYGVNVSTVRRALAAEDWYEPAPRGRPMAGKETI